MKLLAPFFAAVVLTAAPASAEVFKGSNGVNISLTNGTTIDPAFADLKVTAAGASATNGIKRSSRAGDFAQREVTVFSEPYDVKDAKGGKWRMWILSVEGDAVVIELMRARLPGALSTRTFQPAQAKIDGLPTESTYSTLVLFGDGTYSYGTDKGRYKADEFGVTLSGQQAQWGRAVYTVNGDGLIFRFNHGLLSLEVAYADQLNVAER